MAWNINRIASNIERCGVEVRKALETAKNADSNDGRGYGAAATAVEQALQAFGHINGNLIEVKTTGDISGVGKGYLTITVRTIDRDEMSL